MSNSEDDLFCSPRPPAEKSDIEYLWYISFHWDIGNTHPFTLQPINNFTAEEVPTTRCNFKLRDDLRLKKIYVRMLNGDYSIFCKVEKGRLIHKI